jgi:hypothetical protein
MVRRLSSLTIQIYFYYIAGYTYQYSPFRIKVRVIENNIDDSRTKSGWVRE